MSLFVPGQSRRGCHQFVVVREAACEVIGLDLCTLASTVARLMHPDRVSLIGPLFQESGELAICGICREGSVQPFLSIPAAFIENKLQIAACLEEYSKDR